MVEWRNEELVIVDHDPNDRRGSLYHRDHTEETDDIDGILPESIMPPPPELLDDDDDNLLDGDFWTQGTAVDVNDHVEPISLSLLQLPSFSSLQITRANDDNNDNSNDDDDALLDDLFDHLFISQPTTATTTDWGMTTAASPTTTLVSPLPPWVDTTTTTLDHVDDPLELLLLNWIPNDGDDDDNATFSVTSDDDEWNNDPQDGAASDPQGTTTTPRSDHENQTTSDKRDGPNNNNNNDNDDNTNNNDNNNNNNDDNNNHHDPNQNPSNDNDIHANQDNDIYYCQFCDDPNAILPISMWYDFRSNHNNNIASSPHLDNSDVLWAYAAQSVYADEYHQNNNDSDRESYHRLEREQEDQFWKQQYELLQLKHQSSSLSSNDDFMSHLLFAEPPLPLPPPNEDAETAGRTHAPLIEVYTPEIIRWSTPYISAFQSTFVHETGTVRQVLKDYDDECQRRRRETTTTHQHSPPPPLRVGYGHSERILGCDISRDDKYIATASQDSTIRIWNRASQKCVYTIRDHSSQYECLRVTWTDTDHWENDAIVADRSMASSTTTSTNDLDHETRKPFMYLLATGGADGMVHLYGCTNNPDDPGNWQRYTSLNHSNFNHILQKKKSDLDQRTKASSTIETIAEGDEHTDDNADDVTSPEADPEIDYTPQIYALQFIDHWDAGMEEPSQKKKSFLLTSSEDYIHIWELSSQKDHDAEQERQATSAYLPKRIKQQGNNDTGPERTNHTNDHVSTTSDYYFHEVMSLHFGPLNGPAYGVQMCSVTTALNPLPMTQPHGTSCPNYNETFTFGGERNPDQVVYVFDASYCMVNGILGVALSDGSLRLMNGRGVCLSVLQLPGQQSHLTSFHWDHTGQRLATTVATGHVVIWDIEMINPLGVVGYHDPEYSHSLVSAGMRTSCRAVLDGGHVVGRPLYGCHFIGHDQLLISYGSDGRICLWDSNSIGEIQEPLAILWDNNRNALTAPTNEGYPIFAVSVTEPPDPTRRNNGTNDDISTTNETSGIVPQTTTGNMSVSTIVIAGGGNSPGGILGVPIYLQDVYFLNE